MYTYYSEYSEFPVHEFKENGYYYKSGVSRFEAFYSFDEAFKAFLAEADGLITDNFNVYYTKKDLRKAAQEYYKNGFVLVADYSTNYLGDRRFIQIEKTEGMSAE